MRVETAHLLAYGLLAAAMLLFALAAAPEPHAPAWPEPPRLPRLALAFTWPALSLALALLGYLAGLALYLSAGESLAVRALWLAGPLLFLASYLPMRARPDRAATLPSDTWWEWALLAS
ncbi:hypothetical protein [Candidatus Amarolinea dominans]|uniref:hypothetical protein n=1 Tax=Candidatus Amarolinea dominans TaxID=3140696 RepID=UPI0031367F63|nr:hypothetical protein [Anaerolineae bacterium]